MRRLFSATAILLTGILLATSHQAPAADATKPNIDRLAVEGRKFTQCYAGSTVCAPSRSCLMTGTHTGHTTVRNNFAKVGGVPPQGCVPLHPDDVTVAEVLESAGYATGITGKWGLGEPDTPGVPNRQGFHEWLGYLNQRHAHTYYPVLRHSARSLSSPFTIPKRLSIMSAALIHEYLDRVDAVTTNGLQYGIASDDMAADIYPGRCAGHR